MIGDKICDMIGGIICVSVRNRNRRLIYAWNRYGKGRNAQMEAEKLVEEAKALQPQLQEVRRELHKHPELGFDLVFTKPFVKEKLEKMGYKVQECGKAGLIALAGGKKPGRTILLRGDMDALPVQEEADVPFKSQTDGKMHGCGHDMHTTMMLGAAKLLKDHEDEIEGTVKLVFQPAEEIFQGSEDMIRAGELENPAVDAAVMIHVIAGMPLPSGMLLVPGGGVSMCSCEQYHIDVKGKGGHGSMPYMTVDPITAAAQIHLALQEISSRELGPDEYAVFTTGKFCAGDASNVIPDHAEMWGTIRTQDLDGKVGEKVKSRMTEIVTGIGTAMRCEAKVESYDFCPAMIIDEALSKSGYSILCELFGEQVLDMNQMTGGKAGGGSEDFAFVSHKVPTVGFFLTAGSLQEGYLYGQHNPKVRFDDSVLYRGTAAYAYLALRWLEENKA